MVSRANVLCMTLRNGGTVRTALQLLTSVFNTRIWYDGTVCALFLVLLKKEPSVCGNHGCQSPAQNSLDFCFTVETYLRCQAVTIFSHTDLQ